MSETTTQEATVETQSQALAAALWGDNTPPATATVETPQGGEVVTTTEPVVTTTTEPKKEEVVDANEYLKTNLGYDSWDAAKAEIEELRKLKDAKPNEEPLPEEEKKKLFDQIYDAVGKQKQFEAIDKLDVTNVKDAEKLIKMNLQLKHSQLDEAEINDMLQEQYLRYPKPVQSSDELDDEYELKLKAWQDREDAVNRKIVRDAKIVKPDVLKLQSEIVIPDIPTRVSTAQPQPTQEDLDKLESARQTFLKSAETVVSSLNAINATVKDKDVEIPLSYGLSQDEKTSLTKAVNVFAERLDANMIFAERWLTKEGGINAEQMVKDLSKILIDEKATSKLVNDAAAKRLELYLKDKKNINVTGVTSGSALPNGTQETAAALQEHFWGSL